MKAHGLNTNGKPKVKSDNENGEASPKPKTPSKRKTGAANSGGATIKKARRKAILESAERLVGATQDDEDDESDEATQESVSMPVDCFGLRLLIMSSRSRMRSTCSVSLM